MPTKRRRMGPLWGCRETRCSRRSSPTRIERQPPCRSPHGERTRIHWAATRQQPSTTKNNLPRRSRVECCSLAKPRIESTQGSSKEPWARESERRGASRSAKPIDRVLGQGFVRVVTTGARVARIAGHLLATSEASSEMAFAALVVATAIRFGVGMVLTHDPHNLPRLAANQRNVAVVGI